MSSCVAAMFNASRSFNQAEQRAQEDLFAMDLTCTGDAIGRARSASSLFLQPDQLCKPFLRSYQAL